ncbi:MAG: hypothetical protein KBT68_09505 [bacterium]|nr:hypothetical protein [Candidatus Colisoma equi]
MNIRHSNIRTFAYPIISLCLAGCWTVRETAHPAIEVVKLPEGKDVRVQVAGFDATVTTYETAAGYGSVTTFGDSYYGRHGRYYGGVGTTTYQTTEFIPHTESTSVYRDRATDAFERAGCILQTKDPQYRVEVRFEGPFSESGDGWAMAGWMICTIFTADYGAADWSAKLKIHDMKTGKLIHERVFTERDEAVVWGPIPIFSPACSSRNSASVMKDICLIALTDRTVAEAVSVLSAR